MKRETEAWLRIAKEELQSAECLYERSLFRMVCHHGQQAVEKILKAVLTEHGIDFARTHNILDLRNAVYRMGHELPLSDEEAVFLNSIYRARYPSDLGLLPIGEPTREDANQALNIALKVHDWGLAILK